MQKNHINKQPSENRLPLDFFINDHFRDSNLLDSRLSSMRSNGLLRDCSEAYKNSNLPKPSNKLRQDLRTDFENHDSSPFLLAKDFNRSDSNLHIPNESYQQDEAKPFDVDEEMLIKLQNGVRSNEKCQKKQQD